MFLALVSIGIQQKTHRKMKQYLMAISSFSFVISLMTKLKEILSTLSLKQGVDFFCIEQRDN